MLKAGITHYTWKHSGIRTRDTHLANTGKVFSWAVGANNLSKAGARHPGADYRCHCTAVPYTGIIPDGVPTGVAPRPTTPLKDLVKNYFGELKEKVAKIFSPSRILVPK